MAKRTYNLTRIRSTRTLIVGVDIAKKTHWSRMLDGGTGIEVECAFSFQNNTNGFIRLLGKISRAKKRVGVEKIVIAMEPSGHGSHWLVT